MEHHLSIAELCRPISAKVQPSPHRSENPSGIAELVPPPRIRPVVAVPDQPVAVVPDSRHPAPASQPRRKAYHRHDPAVAEARALVRTLCDGTRTVAQIAEASGIHRRTVVDHLKALNMKALKGIPGLPVDAEQRQQTAARREEVRQMVAAGMCGPDIAAHFGVKRSTIHADCIALKIRLPKRKAMFSQAAKTARAAINARRQEQLRQDKIAKAEAEFGRAAGKAVAALKVLGLGLDDIAARLQQAMQMPEDARDAE